MRLKAIEDLKWTWSGEDVKVLTKGKEYKGELTENKDMVKVVNDNGYKELFSLSRFEIIKDKPRRWDLSLELSEVIKEIKEGELWTDEETDIQLREGFLEFAPSHPFGNVKINPNSLYRIYREKVSIKTALKALEKAKEIECCLDGTICSKENIDSINFTVEQALSNWYINE